MGHGLRRKQLVVSLGLLLVLIVLSACNSEPTIVGKWRGDSQKSYDTTGTLASDEDASNIYVTYTSDGIYHAGPFNNQEETGGTYKLLEDGNQLYIELLTGPAAGSVTIVQIDTLTKERLVLSATNSNGAKQVFTFNKLHD